MARRDWKRISPSSLSNAMELCIVFAKERHNLSVDRIADLMSLANKFTLYKWIESGKLPAISIRAFEHACGCDFVTKYLAHSASKLLIDIPVGHCADVEDLQRLNESCHAAVGALIKFYKSELSADEATAAVTVAMEDLAWHRVNVAKVHTPELDFGQ